MNRNIRRTCHVFLCATPFIGLGAAAARPLRIPGVYHAIGAALFLAIVIATWIVGPRVVGLKEARAGKLALAGCLLMLPWGIISVLWVGIGPPFQATLAENYMRFLVLVWNSILVTIGFVVLAAALHEAGERLYSIVGFAAALSAGTAYLVCLNLSLAQMVTVLHGDKTPMPATLAFFYSTIEFVACVMTYATTGVFATALWRARLFGRNAALGYVTASAILVLLIIMRGLEYPEISAQTAPWYTRPGVIAGIPAIPWIMPFLLGLVALRRAGAEQR